MTLFHAQLLRALGWIVVKQGGEIRLSRRELEAYTGPFQLTVAEDPDHDEVVITCK